MRSVRIALAGAGAFGLKHLEALRCIEGVEVVSLIEPQRERAREVADRFEIEHVGANLSECLALPDIEAVILCTPTPVHARQAIECLQAGKHVQVEIPLADSLLDAQAVAHWQSKTDLIAMCGHTRRFNPSHQWIRSRILAGQFTLQQLVVQTHFLRRDNINALGERRNWRDHLLWHHAAHTVDLFAYQTNASIIAAQAMQGPVHPLLGIAMDMVIQLKAGTGALCTVSLSFNNDGPLGSTFRYIGGSGTYIARYDDLVDGQGSSVDLSSANESMNGIELQDREFVDSIREERQPNASVASVLPAYRVLHDLEKQLTR